MEIKAYGKINLSIDVLGKREDGYHDVRMIMQSVGIYDKLNFKMRKDGIILKSSNPYVPRDRRNIVYRTLEHLKTKYGMLCGMEVYIDKRIPIAAGLAGGSADGAAAIIAADRLWGLKLTYEDMVNEARQIGADMAFCLKGGTVLAEGIGEVLTPLPGFEGVNIVLAKPPLYVSTKDVYSNLNLHKISQRPDIEGLIKALGEGDVKYIGENMVNVLETVTAEKYPVIREIKKIMTDYGALGSLMSGSGPTVFGIFKDSETGASCCRRLRDYTRDVYLVETVKEGTVLW